MKSPPPGVILVSQAVCIMFGVEPLKVKDPAGGNKKVDDYWEPAKKKLYGDTNLLRKLIEYDKDHIPESVILKVKPFEADPNFSPEAVAKSSVAAAGICKWVRAMIVYERVAREVGPKRAALAESEAVLKQAQESLATAKAELKVVLDTLKGLEDGLAAAKQKSAELAQQVGNLRSWPLSCRCVGSAVLFLAGHSPFSMKLQPA